MPLSFRRSFQKMPSASINRKKRGAKKEVAARVVRPSGEFRPTKYPLIIPIGCGAAIGLCVFAAFSRGLMGLPRPAAIGPIDYAGIATSAFETALAAQLNTVEAQSPEELPTEVPTLTPAATATPAPTPTPTILPEVVPPSNLWAADIPDAACIPADLPQTGRVVEVVNGDTMKVLMDGDGHVYSVRYIGIRAPQISGDGGRQGLEALARNIELVYRKQAVMVRDISDSDPNGTLLRYVLVDGVFVNQALVSGGFARVDSVAPDTACLSTLVAAEQQARAGGLGLWEVAPPPGATAQ